MSDTRFHVVFTGKIRPGTTEDTVKSNLALALNLTQEKVTRLFHGGEVLIKRTGDFHAAQLIAERFSQQGALCHIIDTEQSTAGGEADYGDSSVISRLVTGDEAANAPHKRSWLKRLLGRE